MSTVNWYPGQAILREIRATLSAQGAAMATIASVLTTLQQSADANKTATTTILGLVTTMQQQIATLQQQNTPVTQAQLDQLASIGNEIIGDTTALNAAIPPATGADVGQTGAQTGTQTLNASARAVKK